MSMTLTTIFFVFGLIFGSFFNVIGLRVPKNEAFANERSRCPHCHHVLKWYELIPVLSFILQLRQCRHCHKKISFVYPVVELTTGFLYAYSFVTIGFNTELITSLLLTSMLMIILVTDITTMIIPNKILLFFFPLFIGMRFIEPLDPWWSAILGSVLGFLLVCIVIYVSRGGMGAGDMKLFAVLGVVLGFKGIILAFFLSCLIGAIVGMGLLLFKVINRKQPIPFGPYIVVAALITYFHGNAMISWYLNFFI